MVIFIPTAIGQESIVLSFDEEVSSDVKTNHIDEWRYKGNGYKGAYFAKLEKSTEFGPTVYLSSNYQPNSWLKAEVWRRNGGSLVVSCDELGLYYSTHQIQKEDKGWEKLEQWVQIPSNYQGEEIRVYFHNSNGKEIDLDELSISFHSFYPYPYVKELPQVHLMIEPESMDDFYERKMKALKIGTITDDLKKWEKAKVDGVVPTRVKVRFKGDWTDHLKNDKWSFRVKVKDDKEVLGLKTFSLQNPVTRYFLSEWLLHKVADEEDVVNTRYDFIQLNLNSRSKGIYAMEQHFTPQLLERFNRPVAPILKFDETGFWEMIRTENKEGYVQNYYQFDVAMIVPIEKKKIYADSDLNQQYLDASWALNHWHHLNPSIHGYVDKEKFATFLALTDLFESYHSLYWINLRFFRNPNTRKLEPILYDGFTEEGSVAPPNSTEILGYIDSDHDTIYHKNQMVIYQFFQDEEFQRLYFSKMEQFSSKEFMEGLKNKYSKQWEEYEKMLQREFPTYHFDFEKIEDRAAQIREILMGERHLVQPDYYPEYESMWDWNKRNKGMPEMNDSTYFSAFGLKALKAKKGVNLVNCHPKSIVITGYSNNKNKVKFDQGKQIKVPAYNPSVGGQLTHFPFEADKVYYIAMGEKYKVKVLESGCLPINWNIKP